MPLIEIYRKYYIRILQDHLLHTCRFTLKRHTPAQTPYHISHDPALIIVHDLVPIDLHNHDILLLYPVIRPVNLQLCINIPYDCIRFLLYVKNPSHII